MDRKEFLKTVALGIAGTGIAAAISDCKKYTPPTAPSNVDFTLDLNDSAYKALKSNGGWIAKNQIIVFRDEYGNIRAVQQTCTHQQCSLEYQPTDNILQCPCHGAIFDNYGTVLQGPATISLKMYKTTLSGNSLRVYS